MEPPFTIAEFLGLFREYNTAVWPAQAALLVIGLSASLAAFRPRPFTPRLVPAALAILWAWTGGVYHLGFFRSINPAALWFGVLCLVQSGLFLRYALRPGTLTFRATRSTRGLLGGLLLVYAFVVYPLLSRTFGHTYPASPTFGVPCPTTIATIGLLLWAMPAPPRRLLLIPAAWTAVGSLAVIQLGMFEDLGLTVAGVIAVIQLLVPRAAPSTPAPA